MTLTGCASAVMILAFSLGRSSLRRKWAPGMYQPPFFAERRSDCVRGQGQGQGQGQPGQGGAIAGGNEAGRRTLVYSSLPYGIEW